jgi:hypothetical protein
MDVVGPGRASTQGALDGQADTSHKQTRIRFIANSHDITTLSMQGIEEPNPSYIPVANKYAPQSLLGNKPCSSQP